jgi:hypothetical protein
MDIFNKGINTKLSPVLTKGATFQKSVNVDTETGNLVGLKSDDQIEAGTANRRIFWNESNNEWLRIENGSFEEKGDKILWSDGSGKPQKKDTVQYQLGIEKPTQKITTTDNDKLVLNQSSSSTSGYYDRAFVAIYHLLTLEQHYLEIEFIW